MNDWDAKDHLMPPSKDSHVNNSLKFQWARKFGCSNNILRNKNDENRTVKQLEWDIKMHDLAHLFIHLGK